MDGYEQVKALAQATGTWGQLQAEVLSRLSEQKQYALLIEIYLKEGQVDRALETLRWVQNNQWIGPRPALLIQVAAAAEGTRPRESISIYTDAAQNLISLRGRDNYIAAAEYLSHVRKLYLRLNEEPTWQALIADIRRQNSSLRALKEELNRLGL